MEWLRLRESLGGGVRQCLIRASTKEKKPKQILRKDEIRQRQEGEEKKGSFRGSAAAIQFQPAIITERWLFRWPQASNHRHKEGRSTNAAPYLSGLPGQRRENQQIMGNSVCRLLTTYIQSTALCGVRRAGCLHCSCSSPTVTGVRPLRRKDDASGCIHFVQDGVRKRSGDG